MSTAYFPVAFSGTNIFEQNRGRTLVVSKITNLSCQCLCIILPKVVASRVDVKGSIHFVENNGGGIDGGALYLTSLGQMVLSPGANLTFERNMGV